jgi:hypothetical protein
VGLRGCLLLDVTVWDVWKVLIDNVSRERKLQLALLRRILKWLSGVRIFGRRPLRR